jgi:hypothetical protein
MMRLLVVLLALANLAFLALSQRWLEPWLVLSVEQREPQRVGLQIEPQALRLLSAQAAAAVQPARSALSCLQAGPYDAAAADAAEARLAADPLAAGRWARIAAEPAGFWLRVPDADATLHERLSAQGFAPCLP